jgi:hypothetical protein
MDRNISVRFYQIEHPNDGSPQFHQILQQLNELEVHDREGGLDDGQVTLRLESIIDQNNIFLGDITRVQTRNLPGHVEEDSIERLPVNRIGHNAAFLFDPETGCLALQFDMSIGVGRVCRYLRSKSHGADFGRLPYLKRDTLNRFRNETPTKLRLKVARVRNFRDLGDNKTDFEEQFEYWSRYYDAPSIEIILATRGEGNSLDHAGVWNTIRRWLGFREEIEGIKNIECDTVESENSFNFIKDLLCEETTLELPDNDPLESRRIRLQYVRRAYDQHRDYVKGQYGS